jgi:hypothetical protein
MELTGPQVGMDEAITAFRAFLTQFKVKYRTSYDVERGQRAREDDGADGEKLLYEN